MRSGPVRVPVVADRAGYGAAPLTQCPPGPDSEHRQEHAEGIKRAVIKSVAPRVRQHHVIHAVSGERDNGPGRQQPVRSPPLRRDLYVLVHGQSVTAGRGRIPLTYTQQVDTVTCEVYTQGMKKTQSLAGDLRGEILVALHTTSTSQAELARRLGLSNKHVSQVLTGKAALSCDLADAMLAAMGRRPVVRALRRL